MTMPVPEFHPHHTDELMTAWRAVGLVAGVDSNGSALADKISNVWCSVTYEQGQLCCPERFTTVESVAIFAALETVGSDPQCDFPTRYAARILLQEHRNPEEAAQRDAASHQKIAQLFAMGQISYEPFHFEGSAIGFDTGAYLPQSA